MEVKDYKKKYGETEIALRKFLELYTEKKTPLYDNTINTSELLEEFKGYLIGIGMDNEISMNGMNLMMRVIGFQDTSVLELGKRASKWLGLKWN